MPRVVITLPAYRAEATLEKTIADIPEGIADELILVDDASPDGTAEKARSLGITVHVHAENRGYGGNQKTCYTEALRDGADIVVLLHPDYQYDPKAVPLLIAPILAGDADMTFGSRFAGLGDPRGGGMPMYRFLGNRLTTSLENLMLGSRFTDMHSGMRAYTRDCLLSLPFLRYSDDFVFDTQLLVDAVTTGQRVVEVPIPTRYTQESSSIDVAASLRYVSSSLAYCARQVARRGRRGRRSPVVRPKRPRRLPGLQRKDARCVACGEERARLVYPANVVGEVPLEEFACTTGALAQHDDIVQCESCGLVFSIPTLAAEEITENYERVVDEKYLAEEQGRRELFSWIVGEMDAYYTRGKRLFEVGSNMGLFLDVAGSSGWQAKGIEPSRWAVEEGRRRFGVDLEQGVLEEHPIEQASADAIVMLDVLEHVNDPMDALHRLRRLVADDGILALSTVNMESLHGRARKGEWPWFIRSHLYYFTPQTVAAMLARAGFRLVEWSVVPRSFHLSYILHRGEENLGALGAAGAALTKVADPKLPVGWLGDITLAIARPA